MTDQRERESNSSALLTGCEAEREAFEKWADEYYLPTRMRVGSDLYLDAWTQSTWDAWQACASAKDARITELEKLAAAISCDCNDTALQRNEAYARIAALESQLAKAQAEVEGYEYILDCEVIAARKYEQPHHRAAPLGWICSRCGASHALWVSECNCPPPVKVTYSSGTGEEPK